MATHERKFPWQSCFVILDGCACVGKRSHRRKQRWSEVGFFTPSTLSYRHREKERIRACHWGSLTFDRAISAPLKQLDRTPFGIIRSGRIALTWHLLVSY